MSTDGERSNLSRRGDYQKRLTDPHLLGPRLCNSGCRMDCGELNHTTPRSFVCTVAMQTTCAANQRHERQLTAGFCRLTGRQRNEVKWIMVIPPFVVWGTGRTEMGFHVAF